MPVNIRNLDLPPERLDELADYLSEKFRMVQTARSNQIDDKASNWTRNYDAIPRQEIKSVPFYRSSNFVPHLIRMFSDILGARILGILFGTKPFWNIKSLLKETKQHEIFEDLSLGMNYLWESELNGQEVADDIVNHSIQTGTLILKSVWSDATSSYLDPAGAFAERDESRMQYRSVPFEDFWPFPITARDCATAEILFQRTRLTRRDINRRKVTGGWDAAAADMLVKDRGPEPIEEAQAQSTGIQLTPDVTYPYSVLECWLRWNIGGQQRPIIVVLNPAVKGRKAILRSYYNFMPYGKNVFIDFRPMPRRNSFYGYSVPEILEQAQEEQAQVHNARRDANTIANVPAWKKKRYADVPNPATDWYPGIVIELDDMDDLEPMWSNINYNSMIDEEQFILSLAERYVGISPSMQGFGQGQAAGKRGIYATGATLALLSEGNRRLDIFLRRLRYPFHRLGELTALAYNQFAPEGFWQKFPEIGDRIAAAFKTVDPQYGSLLYDLSASDAAANREIDRQNLLQMAGTMANYYQQLIQLTQMLGQVPPDSPLHQVSLMVVDGARDLAARLLWAFDIGDRKRIIPDILPALAGGAQPGAGPMVPGGGPGAPGAQQAAGMEDFIKSATALSQTAS